MCESLRWEQALRWRPPTRLEHQVQAAKRRLKLGFLRALEGGLVSDKTPKQRETWGVIPDTQGKVTGVGFM